ncbi:protein takeout-like [Neodiprion fabricii]|uniref:protein takeout-like n=1 Tax=Neodiprion fabricii TaxID=2872261 RepID=UPI001ED91C3F|nr:protein takeout-like [Neodiprion fabricii]
MTCRYFTVFPFIALVICGRLLDAKSHPKIPDFLKICHRSDPNLNECIRTSVEALRPHLREGIPLLDIPACEPLHVPQVEISQGSGPVAVRSTYTDIQVSGATDFLLKAVKVDLEKERTKLKIFLPRLEMVANYTMDGRILMLPITGEGKGYGNYTDINAIVTTQGEDYANSKDGNKTYFRVTDFFVDFNVGHATIHLDNLFNGDETLADAMNVFLNDNWKTVAAEMKPALEDAVAELFMDFANRIYAKFPKDVLFPK